MRSQTKKAAILEGRTMDFIFMLTRHDRTVEDSLELLELIRPLGIRHIGFKDIGVPPQVLVKLADRIQAAGATSYMEVVSTNPSDCLNSARIARELGVDRLLGGTQVDEILDILAGSRTSYFPFPGRPLGHPTKLAGSPEEIEAQCRSFMAKGCPGVDLLAYRATESEPLDLVAASRRGLGEEGYLIVAGSVSTPAQIAALKEAGADAFTIGSAVFDGSFSPTRGSTLSQLEAILEACARLAPDPAHTA
jgi:hypothetical protein